MPLTAPIVLAVVASGLTVETDSPDALCPPLEEARQVIAARVGEVQGGSYVARYGLVYDTESGGRALRLRLMDGESEELLVRELPLEGTSCSDAAVALALVLERYFESAFELVEEDPPRNTSSEEPAEKQLVRPKEEKPELSDADRTTADNAASDHEAAPAQVSGEAQNEPQRGSPLVLHAGLGVMRSVAVAAGIGLELDPHTWWSVAAWGTFQLSSSKIEDVGYGLRTSLHGFQIEPSLIVRPSNRWRIGVGPDLGVQIQVAQVLEVDPEEPGSRVRAVLSGGVHAFLGFQFSRRVQLGVRGRMTGLWMGRPFEVIPGSQEAKEVLSLPDYNWDAVLDFGIRF